MKVSLGSPFLLKIRMLAQLLCAATKWARSSIMLELASLEEELPSSRAAMSPKASSKFCLGSGGCDGGCRCKSTTRSFCSKLVEASGKSAQELRLSSVSLPNVIFGFQMSWGWYVSKGCLVLDQAVGVHPYHEQISIAMLNRVWNVIGTISLWDQNFGTSSNGCY